MSKEAGVNAIIGMGVAFQMMALVVVFLVLRFIWRTLFGKKPSKKLNDNEIDAHISSSKAPNSSESSDNTESKLDLSPKEYVEDEYSPEYKSLDKHWSVAIKYKPSLIDIASKLSMISPELSHKFKSQLIESKNFANASSISAELLMDYLNENFGPNERIISFAKYIILDGFYNAAEELKQAVNVFGEAIDTEFIIDKIQRDFSLDHYCIEAIKKKAQKGF